MDIYVPIMKFLTHQIVYNDYKDTLNEHNIEVNDNFITFSSPPNEEGGEQAMMSFLERNREITGIACYNDSIATGAMSVQYDI